MGLIDSYRRTLEMTEIEERLQALELQINDNVENIGSRYSLYADNIEIDK